MICTANREVIKYTITQPASVLPLTVQRRSYNVTALAAYSTQYYIVHHAYCTEHAVLGTHTAQGAVHRAQRAASHHLWYPL